MHPNIRREKFQENRLGALLFTAIHALFRKLEPSHGLSSSPSLKKIAKERLWLDFGCKLHNQTRKTNETTL